MNEFHHPSPAALAAFVDGRLVGEARTEVVAHLDRCRDCYEVFAGTVRFQRQEEPRGRVIRPARFGAPQWMWWAAAAAVLVVAIVVPVVWEDLGLGGTDGEGGVLPAAAELASALEPGGPGIVAAPWPGWPGGLSFMGDLGGEGVAFRVGVRLMDLAAAARSERFDDADPALPDLERLLAGFAAAGALEEDLDGVRQALEDGDALGLERAVTRLEASAEGVLDPFHLAFGKWAEAGRLAAASGDVAFFRASAFAGFLATLGERELSKPAAKAVGRIEELTRQTLGPEELDELKAAFGGLILRAA